MVHITSVSMQGFKSFANKVTVPFPGGMIVVTGPNGSGKSCRGDTQVLLSTGEFRPIKDIVESALEKAQTHIKLDDVIFTYENSGKMKVLGLDVENMKIVEKDVSAFIKREGEDHLYQIKTKTGRKVTATGCHPVMIFRGDKIVSEVVENLKDGDFIAVPRILNLPENEVMIDDIKIDEDFARFIGYLIGDGYVTNNRVELINSEESILSDFEFLAQKFGLIVKYKKRVGRATRIICWTKTFPDLMKKLLKSDSTSHLTTNYKIIPPEIMLSKKTTIANFLAGLFDCDATVRKDNPTFEYTTKNENLADQVQLSLLRFGIVSRKEMKLKHATNTVLKKKAPYYYIVVEGKEKLRQLYENIPIRSLHKKERLAFYSSRDVKSGSNIDVLPQKVNYLVRDCTKLLGLKYKPMRKKYPWFSAYNENRCCPTRRGIKAALELFKDKYKILKDDHENLKIDKQNLLKTLADINIWKTRASIELGKKHYLINEFWVHRGKKPEKTDIENLYKFLKTELDIRLEKAKGIMKVLENLAVSDVFWDRISKIEKVEGEKWVYDLTIPNCHNFIGNGIFVHNSNIVDAFTFVLGVTSARHIRAHKLQSLIFKGSRKRKESDYCEVVLELDNSDNKIPEYGKEIRLLRRITNSGISVYKVNGKTVNKSKILDILSYAGLSPDGHNIIMQGDITRIIEMNPKERRQIIDEISGIEEFNIKKEEALRRMEKAEARVNEALIVVGEKERRTEQLKKEKESAEAYVEFNKNLRKSNASFLKKKFTDAEEKIKALTEETAIMQKETKNSDAELNKSDKDLEKSEKEFKEVSDKILQTKDMEVVRKIERIKGEVARKEDKIDLIQSRLRQMSLRDPEVHLQLPVKATRFSTVINIPQQYSVAFNVAVGSHAKDYIVQTADEAVQAIQHLRETRRGRARFLPLDKMRINARRELEQNMKGFVGWALDLISYDQKWYPAVSYVLGNVVVFDSINNAKRIAGKGVKAVTLEGDLVEPSGAMVGGWRRPEGEMMQNDSSLREELLKLESEIKDLQKQLAELETKEESSEEQFKDLHKRREEISAFLVEMRQKRKDAANTKFSLQSRINRVDVEKARYETDMKEVKERLKEYSDITEFTDAPLDALQKTIGELTNRIRALGPINMRAIEEFKTVSVEYEQMKQRLEKLLEEKASVIRTIEEVESKRKEKFMATLKEISEGFARIYKDMMGGEADIRLEEESNIDSGLIIEAQPEGKGKIELDAMSGGERTMTSMSFIFSIMQRYASPIYILDEIDAALDKVNTQKIANVIKKYSKKVQFLVISHNDITISTADKVYGTAMEDGVTKIFGVALPNR